MAKIMKRFSDLGVQTDDGRKIFNCQQVSITDILNSEIVVLGYQADIKTKHGEGRCLVHFQDADGTEGKFFTNAQTLKNALSQIKDEDFPFLTVIKAIKCGKGKIYQFT